MRTLGKALAACGESWTKTEMWRRALEGQGLGDRAVARGALPRLLKYRLVFCIVSCCSKIRKRQQGPQDTRGVSVIRRAGISSERTTRCSGKGASPRARPLASTQMLDLGVADTGPSGGPRVLRPARLTLGPRHPVWEHLAFFQCDFIDSS